MKILINHNLEKNSIIIMVLFFLISCSTRDKPAPVVDVTPIVPLSQRVKQSITSTEYIVKKGETLYSIAWRSDVDVRTLAQLNNLSSPYSIYPDQKLFLSKNIAKAIRHKPLIKVHRNNTEKVIKKPVAQIKKQAYGGIVSGNKVVVDQKINKWLWPAKGQVISDYSVTKQINKGINIAGKMGEPIKASADGKVVYTGDALSGYGKLVIVKHNDDYLSAYAHNSHILVKEQQTVKAGDVIAKMGDTDAQRVMLHFEVRFRGKSVNPMKYLSEK